MSRYYIGLSTSGHDPAFAIVDQSGRVIFAEATERYLQDKRAWGVMPDHVGHIEAVLGSIVDQDSEALFSVATSWKSRKEELPVEMSGALLPVSFAEWIRAMQGYVQQRAGNHCRMLLQERLSGKPIGFDHHDCHAANALYFSPVDHGVTLVMDGEGEVGSVSVYEVHAAKLKRAWRSWGPGSLGALYGWLTELCGFSTRLGEEWKVMGLAASGRRQQELVDKIKRLVLVDNGRLLLADSTICSDVTTQLAKLTRRPNDPVELAANIACAAQHAYSELADQVISAVRAQFPDAKNLVLSGGCALNSSFNGSIQLRHGFDLVHVPPAPADDGNAIGAALLNWLQEHPGSSLPTGYSSPFLGSTLNAQDLKSAARHSRMSPVALEEDQFEFLARKLAEGKIIGVARGRAEFGPRALGNRSILADPRPAGAKDRINSIVKGREAYRPLAPAILAERASEWFKHPQASPYMSFALEFLESKRDRVPAVVHLDGSGRLQTVSEEVSPWFHSLLQAFESQSGVPVLLNTSFNVMGKPIVHSVADALAVLATTALDAVVLEDMYFEK